MQEYVLGIASAPDGVVLIEKTHPEWQRGKHNFPGGKVEAGETPLAAMCREFKEETGVEIGPDSWRSIGEMLGEDYAVHIFSCDDSRVGAAETVTDEEVCLVDEDELHESYDIKCVHNVRLLHLFAVTEAARHGCRVTLDYRKGASTNDDSV